MLSTPVAPRAASSYRQLDEAEIMATIGELRDRIAERFPQANLRGVCEQLLTVAHEASGCVAYLRRPNWTLRILGGAAIVGLVMLLLTVAAMAPTESAKMTFAEVVQTIEAGVNDIVFFGIAVFFLLSIETRVKRRRALVLIHELRSLAHIVDMHQLTKDPERLRMRGPAAEEQPSPPKLTTGAELAKYLDFCSELLSLTSKVAALLVQDFNDSVVLAGVDEIETLTTGLSGKVWQKITILEQ